MQGTRIYRMHRFLETLTEVAHVWRPMVQPVRLSWSERVETAWPREAGRDVVDCPGAGPA